MKVDQQRGLITVFMVQHNGFTGNGGKSREAFEAMARQRFSSTASN